METERIKIKATGTYLSLVALTTSMFLLLFLEATMPAGAFLVLAAYSLAIFLGIFIAAILSKEKASRRVEWIACGFIGLLLNWTLGFMCA